MLGVAAGRETGEELGRETGLEVGRDTGVELGRETGPEVGRDTGVELGRETGVELGRETGLGEGRETGREPPPLCPPPLDRVGVEPRPPPREAPRWVAEASSAQRQRPRIKLRARDRRRNGIANSPAPKGFGRRVTLFCKRDARLRVAFQPPGARFVPRGVLRRGRPADSVVAGQEWQEHSNSARRVPA